MKFTSNRNPPAAPSGTRHGPTPANGFDVNRRIAELTRKQAGDGLSGAESVTLTRLKKVAPPNPNPDAELREALGLAPDEEN